MLVREESGAEILLSSCYSMIFLFLLVPRVPQAA